MSDALPLGRRLEDITSADVAKANASLIDLVKRRLPERIYRGQGLWPIVGTALVAHMAGTVASISTLVDTRRETEVAVLLRLLYEQAVTFCWLAVDPARRIERWQDDANIQRLRLHNDAVQFGITLLSPEEAAEASTLQRLPGLADRAEDVDAYWAPLIRGFRPRRATGPLDLLTMRGLFVAIYRMTSRAAHAQVDSVDPCVDLSRYPRYPAVVQFEEAPTLMWAPLSTPVFALALLVCNHRLGWPDEHAVRSINAALLHGVDTSVD